MHALLNQANRLTAQFDRFFFFCGFHRIYLPFFAIFRRLFPPLTVINSEFQDIRKNDQLRKEDRPSVQAKKNLNLEYTRMRHKIGKRALYRWNQVSKLGETV